MFGRSTVELHWIVMDGRPGKGYHLSEKFNRNALREGQLVYDIVQIL